MNERKYERCVQGSFRDPSGFLFTRDGAVYRQVNVIYRENYDHLIKSGLYKTLVGEALLIPHEEVDTSLARSGKAYAVIKPEMAGFVSYPYEWCFSQLKDAAMMTLEIHKKSLEFGMSLKDCSAYNVQFRKGRPVFVDTLSFEKYREGEPWVAYRQFCQHFLAPLALMARRDVRLNQLLRIYIDGIPLDLAARLLPKGTFLDLSLLMHIHAHAGSQKRFADKTLSNGMKARRFGRLSMHGLIDSLGSAIKKLRWTPRETEWADYYKDTNYSSQASDHKREIVARFLDKLDPGLVWDLGANVGIFSRIAAERGAQTISFDKDPAAVEKNYLECVSKGETDILPLLLDLTNPSPGIGWENKERMSIFERGPADTALALAIIHHLAISNNLPFRNIADLMRRICNSLVMEFIPKSDSQAQRLLSSREDIFSDYTREAFEDEFQKYFAIQDSVKIKNSERTLYMLARKQV